MADHERLRRGGGGLWYGMGWMVRRDNPHAPALEENVWHDGALDGTNVSAAAASLLAVHFFLGKQGRESLNLRLLRTDDRGARGGGEQRDARGGAAVGGLVE